MTDFLNKKLRYEDQTRNLLGLIFDVHNTLRIGWSEEVYHQATVAMARERGIPIVSKQQFTLSHKNIEVQTFECDLMVWDLIILELKVLPNSTFSDAHFSQIISYLKCWGKSLGLLVNYGPMRVQTKRVIWDEPVLVTYENLDALSHKIAIEQETIHLIQQAAKQIALQYGLGFPESVYRNIMTIELRSEGVNFEQAIKVPATLNGQQIRFDDTNYLIVSDSILLNFRALLDFPSKYDFAQMKTYLNQLGLRTGILVNFGKKQLQLFAVPAT